MLPSVLPILDQRLLQNLLFFDVRNRVLYVTRITETDLFVPFNRPYSVFNLERINLRHIERQFG